MLQTNDDNCRKWQIIKLFASGPYHQFSVGCQETLSAENIREELVRFYQEKYSADRMNAVLLSSFSIEDMKELMLPFLKEIPNKHTQKLIYEPHFEHKNLGHFLQM